MDPTEAVQRGEFTVAVAGGPGSRQRPGVAVGGWTVPALLIGDPAEVVQGDDVRGRVAGGLYGGQGVLMQGVRVGVVAAQVQVAVQDGGLMGGVLRPVAGGIRGGGEEI